MILQAELPKIDTVEARITNIRWRAPDEESSRCIVTAAPSDGGKPFSVVGDIDNPTIGQVYEFEGRFSFNDRYRVQQLALETYRTVLPDDLRGIQRYMVDTAKWVGPPVAKQITQAFGKDSLRIIKTDPARVASAISGITLERAKEMSQSLIDNEENEKATVELHQIIGGTLPKSVTKKAINAWGSDAAAIVRRDPFRLTELSGVGFPGADAVWKSLKMSPGDPRRKRAAVLYVMHELHQSRGDTVLDRRTIEMQASKYVGTVEPEIFEVLRDAGAAVEPSKDVWSLAEIYEAERYVASRFNRIKPEAENPPVVVNVEGLAPDQIEAAKMFEGSRVMVLTGAPGTGKTYTTARLVEAVKKHGGIELAAPTGKAAKQMSLALADTCGGYAQTIHRMLGPNYDEETKEFWFTHDADNPLSADVVVIDETSMVDINLAKNLLSALRDGVRLLFVGDTYQLPSVGPGSFLRDLIAAGVPSFELTQIKRNAGDIVKACHAIKDGKLPTPSPNLDIDAGLNWRHIEVDNADHISAVIHQLYTDHIPALNVADMTWDVQTISPMNERGSLSCAPINATIQRILNPHRVSEKYLDFSVGDKVVRLKNGNAKGEYLRTKSDEADEIDAMDDGSGDIPVVNGDIGVVEKITDTDIVVKLVNPDRRVTIRRREHYLRLAYCMTCHKLQGSEAKIVVVPLHKQFSRAPIWNREWIYTAFSRAKVALITVGEMSALRSAVERVGNTKRRTMLKELIR